MTHAMSCDQCRDMLPWYVAATLASSERERIEQHLATCAACQQEVQFWRQLGGALDRADRAIPPEISVAPAWQTMSTQLFTTHHANKAKKETSQHMIDHLPKPAPSVDVQQARSNASPQRRRSAWLVPVAALLLVLIGVVVLAAQRPHHSTSGAVASATMALPAGTQLTAVDMLTPHDIWAVGYVANGSSDVVTPTAVILHYTGDHWVRIDDDDYPASTLNAIAMSGPDEGWAVGSTGLTTASSAVYQPFLLHYTQGHWTKVPTPLSTAPATNGQLMSINAISANSVWFAGNGTANQGAELYTFLWHYAQGSWSSAPAPAAAKVIDMTADDAGWAISASTIWQYQHGQWTAQYTNPAIQLYRLAMTSSQNGWASGYYQSPSSGKRLSGQGNATSALLHYDGKSWSLDTLPSTVLTPATEAVGPFFMQSDQDGWGGVDVLTSDNMTQRYVLRYHAGTWTREYIGTGYLQVVGMLVTSPTEGWAVTARFGSQPHGQSQLSLLHDSNGVWSVYSNS